MNIMEIVSRFENQSECIRYLEQVRWGDTPICPYCKSTKTTRNQHRHYCYTCKTSFSVTVGTIFHQTHLPLQKWLLAVSLVLNAKKGLSALQLSRDLQVNKNTAWRIGMQIRKAMSQQEHRKLLTGIIEMDETYVGGKPRKGTKNNPPGRGTKKAPVVGAVERGGHVTAKATKKDELKGKDMRAFVRDRVDTRAAHLMTDGYKAYNRMNRILPHDVINHEIWYVDGDIHTNTIENFWSLLKRGMFGQYHSVSRKHLQRYVDEFCFRYNRRKMPAMAAFESTIKRGVGLVA